MKTIGRQYALRLPDNRGPTSKVIRWPNVSLRTLGSLALVGLFGGFRLLGVIRLIGCSCTGGSGSGGRALGRCFLDDVDLRPRSVCNGGGLGLSVGFLRWTTSAVLSDP